jgi:pimeloyl-ACP methyl ester carboxylesterase
VSRLQRQRDGQQWILDYLVMTTGRDRNFGVDHQLWPLHAARNSRMVARVMTSQGEDFERLARASKAAGHHRTARVVFHKAVQAYKTAQHAVMSNGPVKSYIYSRLNACYDEIIALADGAIERVEIPFEGRTFPGLLHLVDDRARPTVLYVPGMDATKEQDPDPNNNVFAARGFNVLVIDGPGQGESNLREIWVTDDNYERAASAAIDVLVPRPEVDATRLAVLGLSMGSFWACRTAAYDSRVRAVAAAMGVFMDKRYIFDLDSPHFKQMFMYMSGTDDEDEFDAMAERMTLRGYGSRIRCPTLLCNGEFDPLCPLEDAYELYEELAGPKELWVAGGEAHRLRWVDGLGGMSVLPWCLDWLSDALDGRVVEGHAREVYLAKGGSGPFAPDAPEPTFRSWHNGVGV